MVQALSLLGRNLFWRGEGGRGESLLCSLFFIYLIIYFCVIKRREVKCQNVFQLYNGMEPLTFCCTCVLETGFGSTVCCLSSITADLIKLFRSIAPDQAAHEQSDKETSV